jgi:hypothetical protein
MLKRTSDRCHITMSACFVSFILFPVTVFPKISPILFLNGKLRKTAVNPPNFWALVYITPFHIKFYRQDVVTPFFLAIGRLINLKNDINLNYDDLVCFGLNKVI